MSIEERLSRLERQNRWLKRLGALAIAVGAVVVLVGQGKDPLKRIYAKEFILKHELYEAARLTAVLRAVSLGLNSRDGKGAAGFTVMSGGEAFITFSGLDREGTSSHVRASFGTGPDGSSSLLMYDQDGGDRVHLSVDSRGSPSLKFYDANGKVIWKAPGE
jgi:hypothetical protein